MTKNQLDSAFEGKVAIVTGGGRGLGRAFALALAAQGMSVAIASRSEDQVAETVRLVEQAGGRAIDVPVDVTDGAAVEQMVISVERTLGPVDLLINNAGTPGSFGRMWEVDPEAWWRSIEVNLRGVFLCSRTVLPGMIERRYGRIIDVASVAGLGPWPYASGYSTGKAAVIRFNENVAAETQEYGICVFSLHPGMVRTAMTEYVASSDDVAQNAPGIQQRFQEIFEEGSHAPPEHAVSLVLYLASGQADALSGRYISITDDVEELVKRAEDIQENNLQTLRLNT